jgi:hypothetical protein
VETLTEWFEVFAYMAVWCISFFLFVEPFRAIQSSSRAKVTVGIFWLSSALVFGLGSSFGWQRAFHGGLFWISSVGALAMLASGIMVRRLPRHNDPDQTIHEQVGK